MAGTFKVWESYNHGPCFIECFLDRSGEPFSGEPGDFEKLHGDIIGLRNTETDRLVLLNEYGQIAAYGSVGDIKLRKNQC